MSTTVNLSASGSALAGWVVLIPRGGELGDRLALGVQAHGGTPLVDPVMSFSEAHDTAAIDDALARLATGEFDWLAVTSATTVDVLVGHRAAVPPSTRVAAVGPATRSALEAAGFPVYSVPEHDHSAAGMVAAWPAGHSRVLIAQSASAKSTLATGLTKLGNAVETVTAYQPMSQDLRPATLQEVTAGRVHAVLLTSGEIAREVAAQAGHLPQLTVACIGEPTATAAAGAGLKVAVVSPESSAEALVAALADFAMTHPSHDLPTRPTVR